MSLLRFAVLFVSLLTFARGAVGIGDTREDVLTKLAKPTSTAKRANREIFMYAGGGRVEIVDGRVESATGSLPEAGPAPATPAYAPPPAPAAPAVGKKATVQSPKSQANPANVTPVEAPQAIVAGEPTKTETGPNEHEQALENAGIKTQKGPTTVSLGKTAQLKLPAGFSFVGPGDIDRFYELTHNTRGGREVGVILGPKDWMLFFEYNDIGYVKDEDKDKLNADKLMKAMTENEDDENAERTKRGWDAMKIKSWATPPHYDEKTHNLKWAINLASSQDNFKSVWINESIRLLGRGGVMNVTLVVDPPMFKVAEVAADKLLSENYSYVAGEKYAEFKKGDKVAAYGLTALVLGGAGVVAAKAGLLSKFGYLVAKAWKGVVALIVVILAGLKKILAKILGAKAEEPPNA